MMEHIGFEVLEKAPLKCNKINIKFVLDETEARKECFTKIFVNTIGKKTPLNPSFLTKF